MKLTGILGGAALAIAGATGAQAATLTFDTPKAAAQVESGYTYVNNSGYSVAGALQLTDDGGRKSAAIAKVDGGTFDAVSVDMTGVQRAFNSGSPVKFNNYKWNGYRNGQVVASDAGGLDNWNNFTGYSFGSEFAGLTKLELVLTGPDGPYSVVNLAFGRPAPGTTYCDLWCAGIAIDNLVLTDSVISAVPVPGGLVLMGSALGLGLIGFGRRRAKPTA
ncbi:MAG: hypothetical protein ACSHXD_10965 [Marinosulfonomonas sp.]